jgi:uncharacterized membrane protein
MNSLWLILLGSNLLLPVMMLVFGYVMTKHPPKKINSLYGYRTKRSMKNMDTWVFAHQVMGKYWIKYSVIGYLLTMIFMFVIYQETEDQMAIHSLFLTAILLILMIIPIIMTERQLNENFDEHGNKK